MYLALIIISIIALFIVSWQIALPVLVIVFCLDRVIDRNRRELEEKISKKKQ